VLTSVNALPLPPESSGRPRSRRRRTTRRVLVGIAILGLLAGIAAVVFDGQYGVWPTETAHPWHVHVCGRDYKDTGLVQSRHDAAGSASPVGELVRIATFAPPVSFTPVWGVRTPGFPTTPCGMVVYLEQPDGQLASYTLQGGP